MRDESVTFRAAAESAPDFTVTVGDLLPASADKGYKPPLVGGIGGSDDDVRTGTHILNPRCPVVRPAPITWGTDRGMDRELRTP
jgi:hypothetical protein